MMRVGILTAGGDCPGLNAAIRSVSKALMQNYNADIIGIEDGFLGLIERRIKKISYQDCSDILALGGTILRTHNKVDPTQYQGFDFTEKIKNYYRELGLNALVVIGGDGTLSAAHNLAKADMNIVAIPKTIDNDLACNDRTIGFDTATSIVTEAIDRLRTTGQSHKRVMILETMGRHSGWIALHAGIAGGADVILLPEYPYDINEVVDACERRQNAQCYSVVVIAEGARPKGGNTCVKEVIGDSVETQRLGGIGEQLKAELEQHMEAEIRSTTLGHIQRGGSPTTYDRIFATNIGTYAAALVAAEQYNRVAVVQDNKLTSVPIEQVANKSRKVSENDMSLLSAFSLGVSLGDPELHMSLADIKDKTFFIE